MKLFDFCGITPTAHQVIWAENIDDAMRIYAGFDVRFLKDRRADHWYIQYNGRCSVIVYESEYNNEQNKGESS